MESSHRASAFGAKLKSTDSSAAVGKYELDELCRLEDEDVTWS